MIQLFFGLLLVFLLFGCEGIAKLEKRLSTDVKLIGMWKGEHQEKGGVLKRWVQTRNADGTYVIEFSFTEINGTTKSLIESGQWWIQNGLFHEVTLPANEQPDKYRYSFHVKECVSFVLVESKQSSQGSSDYAFSECLVADSPPVTIDSSI